MSLILHQFPISHFSEKIRWALDFKGLDYQLNNYAPGFHAKPIQRLAKKTSVPVLEHDGAFIQGSAQIIDYLDEHFPQNPLTPNDPELSAEAREWEAYADKHIGYNSMRYTYHYMFERPSIVFSMWGQGVPFWRVWVYKLVQKKLIPFARRYMKVNEETAAAARAQLLEALDKISQRLQTNDVLVGGQFTRADIAVAALMAPLFMPEGYGDFVWPKETDVPEELLQFKAENADKLKLIEKLYQDYR